MTKADAIKMAIDVLNNSRGDDYERAKIAFKNFTTVQMNKPYGMNPTTPNQILESYKRTVDNINEAITILRSL